MKKVKKSWKFTYMTGHKQLKSPEPNFMCPGMCLVVWK